jgi:hypothetical protein
MPMKKTSRGTIRCLKIETSIIRVICQKGTTDEAAFSQSLKSGEI